MAKSGKSNPFGSATATDAPAPENGRQRHRWTGGGGVTIHDTTINQIEQEASKAKASVASEVDAVADDEAKEAKKDKEGGDTVENPDNTGPRRRQISSPTKAGTRETMSGNNVIRTGRRRRGGEQQFTQLNAVNSHASMLDAVAAPKMEELDNEDCNNCLDCRCLWSTSNS